MSTCSTSQSPNNLFYIIQFNILKLTIKSLGHFIMCGMLISFQGDPKCIFDVEDIQMKSAGLESLTCRSM